MPDKIDKASEITERELKESIERARLETPKKRGPVECWRCHEWNDRARDGFCICSDCFEVLNGS